MKFLFLNRFYNKRKYIKNVVYEKSFLVGYIISLIYAIPLFIPYTQFIHNIAKVEIPSSYIPTIIEHIFNTLLLGTSPYIYIFAIFAGFISFFITDNIEEYNRYIEQSYKIGAYSGFISSITLLLEYIGHFGIHLIRSYTTSQVDSEILEFVILESGYGFFYPLITSIFLGIIGYYLALIINFILKLFNLEYL